MAEITQNVKDFIDRCGAMVGGWTQGLFISNLKSSFRDYGVWSPIEQLFETAVRTIVKLEGCEYDPYPDPVVEGKIRYNGVWIRPQVKIGEYCVDYCISVDEYRDVIAKMTFPVKKIVVELDGHAFHETTEKQRRYEKERDRYMQKKGYKVFRYTGAEIVSNPFHAAFECLGELGVLGAEVTKFWQGDYHD